MALRDQPYLPLYIQDIMTDEKLNECSAATHGIYIKGIMCLMHKSENYGKILLMQKHKQTPKQNLNFARQLARHLPYEVAEIEAALDELIECKVCHYEGDFLCQKRMIRDHEISVKRSESGNKGVEAKKKFGSAKKEEFAIPKGEANSEYEFTFESESDLNKKNGVENSISAIDPINPDLMGFLGRVRHWMESEHNYIWSDQDSKAAAGLEAKLKELHRRDNLHTDDKTLFQSYQLMVNRLDGWVKTNKFSLNYFNQNFNEIITGIKSGKQGNNADEKRRAGVARIFHELTTGPQFE